MCAAHRSVAKLSEKEKAIKMTVGQKRTTGHIRLYSSYSKRQRVMRLYAPKNDVIKI